MLNDAHSGGISSFPKNIALLKMPPRSPAHKRSIGNSLQSPRGTRIGIHFPTPSDSSGGMLSARS